MKKLLTLICCLLAFQVSGQQSIPDRAAAAGMLMRNALRHINNRLDNHAIGQYDTTAVLSRYARRTYVDSLVALGGPGGVSKEHIYLNAKDLGFKADAVLGALNLATDNYPRFVQYMDSLPDYVIPHIYWPKGGSGGYYFSQPMRINDRHGVDFIGEPNIMPYYGNRPSVATIFYFPANTNGIRIVGDRTGVPMALSSSLTDISIISAGSTAASSVSGVSHEVICQFTRLYVEGFSYGYYTQADVADASHSNSSLSVYTACRAVRNTLDGFYAGGPDANAITYNYCVSVLNYRWGFMDNSFLGNFYYGCQTATNGRDASEAIAAYQGGGYCILQASAFSLISGCYSEADQLPNYQPNGGSIVMGGIHDNRWCSNAPGQPYQLPGGAVQSGYNHNKIAANWLQTPEIYLANEFTIKNVSLYGEPSKTGLYGALNVPVMEWIGAHAPQALVGVNDNNQPTPKRGIPVHSVSFASARWVGTQLHIDGDTNLTGIPFVQGDKIINASWTDSTSPDHWRVTQGGRNHTFSGTEFQIATMGAWDGGDQTLQFMQLTQDTAYRHLRVGDYLTLPNSTLVQIWSIDSQTKLEIYKPVGSDIRDGQQINFMNKWVSPLQPVKYSAGTITVVYNKSEPARTVGDSLIVDGSKAVVVDVVNSLGVQKVTVGLPKGLPADVYNPPANVGWGSPSQTLTPVAYINSGTDSARVTAAFANTYPSAGATVWVNGASTQVKKVIPKGISIKKISGGSVVANTSGAVIVQKPRFQPYYFVTRP